MAPNGHVYTPKRTKDYEQKVALCALGAGCKPTELSVSVTLSIYYPDARRRDIDNTVKSVMDGLNGLAFADDSQVVDFTATKSIDRERPRVEATITEVTSVH